MNETELRIEMLRHHDTQVKLAAYLGISTFAINNRIKGKVLWKRSEIRAIKKRYSLSNDRVLEIFFAELVS